MRTRSILLVLVVGALIASLLVDSADRGEQELADDLDRRSRASQSAAEQPQELAEPDWATLAAEGKGLPVPAHYIVDPFDGDGYWLIQKPGATEAAGTPFAPGRFPTLTSDREAKKENPGFVGADVCRQCHEKKTDSFVHTAHYRTSRIADINTISGSFEHGSNVLHTRSPAVQFEMVQRDEQCFQRVSYFSWRFEVPFDMIVGSAKLGESYLYWHGDQLYQSNVTYLTMNDRWINSPGYDDGDAAYARPIRSRCVDCHFTYIDYRGPPNHYSPDSLILGVSCERCHGPADEHVTYHQQNREEKKAMFISVPTMLARDKQLQLCGQCHSTITPILSAPFSFRPGDDLADHYAEPDPQKQGDGVHTSNQLARIGLSKCFQQSEMVCADCHNPHRQERGNKPLFSQRCLSCHETEECGMHDEQIPGLELDENCVDCHMPQRASENLHLETASGTVFPPLRDHHIRVDLSATDDFLQRAGQVP